MKKSLMILLSAILVLGMILPGAAEEWERGPFIHSPFSQVKDKMKPVNLSCEDQGIRITVDSALVRDDRLWISYQLEDLEGSRIDENLFASCAYKWIDCHMETDDKTCIGGSSNQTTDHGVLAQYIQSGQLKDMETLSVSIEHFPVVRKYRIPLAPLLEKYGQEEAPAIESSSIISNSSAWMFAPGRVIDFSQAPDVPLSDEPETAGVLLGGIGWIDGLLHVQVHFTENEDLSTEELMRLERWDAELRNFYGETGDYSRAGYATYGFQKWSVEGDNAKEWAELTADCKPKDAEKLEKYFIELTCVQEVLDGNWEFSIPMDQIRTAEKTKGTIYENYISEPLVEIDYGCEDQGIRISAVAARVTEDNFMVLFDLQDPEGHRIDSDLAWAWPELAKYNVTPATEGNQHIGQRNTSSTGEYGGVMHGYNYSSLDSDDFLSVTLNTIPVWEKESAAVLPLLEKYGTESEGCTVREHYSLTVSRGDETRYTSRGPDNYIVLDYTQPLDIPLSADPENKEILLGNIGWIDGRLHILIHYIDHDRKGEKLGESAFQVWDCDVNTYDVDMYCKWDADGDGVYDFKDIVIDCKPDDPGLADYTLKMKYIREFVDGNWEINIPLDEIR